MKKIKAKNILFRLIEPSSAIQDAKQRRQAQLLAALMILVAPLGVIAAILPDLFSPDENWWQDPEFRMMLVVLVFVALIYILSRTRYYQAMAIFTVLGASVAIFYAAIPDDSAEDVEAFFFLIIPVLLSSVFLSVKQTIAVILLNIAGVGATLMIVTTASHIPIINALTFIVVVAVIILLSTYLRDLLETDRQSALSESENRYRSLFEATFEGVIIHKEGQIVEANPGIERILGGSHLELIGKSVFDFVADESQELVWQNFGTGESYEIVGLRSDKSRVYLEIVAKRQIYKGQPVHVVAVRDITAHKQAQQRIANSLQEKEALLKEIHHRVKNNLQVISSLLNLQSGQIEDEQTRVVFQESQNRIRSMALIHEKLYQSQDLSQIDFGDYVDNLIAILFRSYGSASSVAVKVEVRDVFLSAETAVLCGLILNELFSNAIKHAFVDGRSGQIIVKLEVENKRYCLTIADNGVGFPPQNQHRQSNTLGLQLVHTLVGQLGGDMTINNRQGTTIIIAFEDQLTKEST